jgi:DNA-binding LacI/PurR family transcriptional regulator
MGVLAAAEERGLEVPRDLSVVGYDDIEIASYLGLTTVHQPLFESGREAAQLLLDCLATGDSRGLPPQKRTLPLPLTLRRTTAPPESVPAD